MEIVLRLSLALPVLFALTLSGPARAERDWLWGIDNAQQSRVAADQLGLCVSSSADGSDCVRDLEGCQDHVELCIDRETFAWQTLGQDYLDLATERYPELASQFSDSQDLWRAYAASQCRLAAYSYPDNPVMSRITSARCRRDLTVERVLLVRGQLLNLGWSE